MKTIKAECTECGGQLNLFMVSDEFGNLVIQVTPCKCQKLTINGEG